jgi:hypothetical protein
VLAQIEKTVFTLNNPDFEPKIGNLAIAFFLIQEEAIATNKNHTNASDLISCLLETLKTSLGLLLVGIEL